MIRFIEVINETNFNSRLERTANPKFTLGEVWLNEDHVVSIREAKGYKTLLKEGLLPPDLDSTHAFSSVTTNNGRVTETHVIVGTPSHVASRLSQDRQMLLKG